MARKKILDCDSCKFTLNLNGDNKKVLDKITDNYILKYGPMINKIIKTFCLMPDDVLKVIEKVCREAYENLNNEIEHTEENSFHREPLIKSRDWFYEILKITHGGSYPFCEEEKKDDEPSMRKVRLLDGYLIIPSDWILVNEEEAANCRYAAVMECRNSAKHGVPHFIYFNNFQYAREYTEDMEKRFLSLCEKAWPRFKEIRNLSDRNQLVPDPENKGEYLNVEAYLAAPTIGLFHIAEQCNRKLPYGAMIIRTDEATNETE